MSLQSNPNQKITRSCLVLLQFLCGAVVAVSSSCTFNRMVGGRHHPKKTSPPTHLSPSPSPVDNAVPPSHMASSPIHVAPFPVDDMVPPPHMAPSLAPAPTTSCIKMDDYV